MRLPCGSGAGVVRTGADLHVERLALVVDLLELGQVLLAQREQGLLLPWHQPQRLQDAAPPRTLLRHIKEQV